jgi:hypothetical protein
MQKSLENDQKKKDMKQPERAQNPSKILNFYTPQKWPY